MAGALAAQAAQAEAPPLAACDAHFSPPHQAQRLTRTLTRDLSDGKQIIASRSYRIRFVRQGRFYRVEGEQVAVEVSAPPQLAPLTRLEQERVDRESFPVTLDHDGRILREAQREAPMAPGVGAAIDATLAQSARTPANRAATGAMAHALATPGANLQAVWPEDVFNAIPGTREQTMTPNLPDGTQGEIVMTLQASHADCGARHWPETRMLQRDVVTRMGKTTRHSREVWTIEPDGQSSAQKR